MCRLATSTQPIIGYGCWQSSTSSRFSHCNPKYPPIIPPNKRYIYRGFFTIRRLVPPSNQPTPPHSRSIPGAATNDTPALARLRLGTDRPQTPLVPSIKSRGPVAPRVTIAAVARPSVKRCHLDEAPGRQATIRAIVNGYAAGRLNLDAPDPKASEHHIRFAPSFIAGSDVRPSADGHPHTAEAIADCLP